MILTSTLLGFHRALRIGFWKVLILWHCREKGLVESLVERQEEAKKAAVARYRNSSWWFYSYASWGLDFERCLSVLIHIPFCFCYWPLWSYFWLLACNVAKSSWAFRDGCCVCRVEGAMVAIDPMSGAVRVLVGGRDYYDSNFNRATQVHWVYG